MNVDDSRLGIEPGTEIHFTVASPTTAPYDDYPTPVCKNCPLFHQNSKSRMTDGIVCYGPEDPSLNKHLGTYVFEVVAFAEENAPPKKYQGHCGLIVTIDSNGCVHPSSAPKKR